MKINKHTGTEGATKMKRSEQRKHLERGSISLEYILYIGAVVLISGAIFGFYRQIGTYFNTLTQSVAGLEDTIQTGGTTDNTTPQVP